VLLIANTLDQARIAFDYVVAFLTESPILRNEIESITQHEVRLKNRIIIGVHTLSFRSIRGRTLLAVVSDETAYLRDESSANPDVEIYRACMPALAAANGMWISISTGYMKAGLLYEKWRQHWGQPSDDVLVINGTTAQFNSTIDPAVIERARTSDQANSRSEGMPEV